MKDQHPYQSFIPKHAHTLIIGTFPPHRFCSKKNLLKNDVNFYYGSKDNHFWKLIGEVCNIEFSNNPGRNAVADRKSYLINKKIGITDLIAHCKRKNNGSSDNDLYDIKYKNIAALLKKNPKINKLIYTSEFVKKCMYKILSIQHVVDRNNRKINTLTINGKTYEINILYSPSPNGLRNLGTNGKEIRKNQYRMVFMHKIKEI